MIERRFFVYFTVVLNTTFVRVKLGRYMFIYTLSCEETTKQKI